ncbi:MAG: PP2C family protein-serine/threonine phosphatase [Candidatus Baltobacteraceae bacterium]
MAYVVGLLVLLVLASYLSYGGSVKITDAFSYQSAVVAAQRDVELLEVEQFDRKSVRSELRPYEKLLASDLLRIDAIAQTQDERAPVLRFPATREDYARLDEILHDKEVLGRKRFDDAVARNTLTRNVANALFALVAVLFVLLEGRLRRRVEEGRSLVERLQRAFISKRRDLPNVDLGSVLISATRGSSVGGDTHDVFTFDRKNGMFMVADVSGKGIDAAVDTALVKYSIRTLFSENDDPGWVLAKFAAIYARSAESLESFIVLFLGVIDLETGRVRYASAGHEPAWFRCGQDVVLLPTTGPIVGMEPAPEYGTKTLLLGKGDVVVVGTDGLTESRDSRGRQLGAEGVAAWLTELSGGAQATAEAIVKRLRKRSTRITDDLALLVVRYMPRLSAGVVNPAGTAGDVPSQPQLVGGEASP